MQFFEDATHFQHQCIRNQAIKFGGYAKIAHPFALIVMRFLLDPLHIVVSKSIFSLRGGAIFETGVVGKHAQRQHLGNGPLPGVALQQAPYVLPPRKGVIDLALVCHGVYVARFSWFYASGSRKNITLKFI